MTPLSLHAPPTVSALGVPHARTHSPRSQSGDVSRGPVPANYFLMSSPRSRSFLLWTAAARCRFSFTPRPQCAGSNCPTRSSLSTVQPKRGRVPAVQGRPRSSCGLRRHGAAFPSRPAHSARVRIVPRARAYPPCSQSGDLSPHSKIFAGGADS